MSSASIHDKLSRVRKPRVHITYEVETEGAKVQKELPFVMGVLGDFSGKPTQPLKPLKDRKFIQIDRDNFNEVMARMTPGLEFRVENTLKGDGSEMAVKLKFNALEDFEPGRVVQQVEPLEETARDARQAPRSAHQGRPLRRAREPARANPQERRGHQETVGANSAWAAPKRLWIRPERSDRFMSTGEQAQAGRRGRGGGSPGSQPSGSGPHGDQADRALAPRT